MRDACAFDLGAVGRIRGDGIDLARPQRFRRVADADVDGSDVLQRQAVLFERARQEEVGARDLEDAYGIIGVARKDVEVLVRVDEPEPARSALTSRM